MDNKKKYEQVFIKSFKLNSSKLKKDVKYNSIPQWDSVGHMSMIAKLEDAFKITFEMDDIIDFSSFNTGKKILKKYKVKIWKVKVFYEKEKLENSDALKEDFRHLGQKPSSKESAILMLADSLEAACRAIFMVEDADEEKIKSVIEEIFNEKIADDQLSKAPITFEELSIIKDSFQKSLEGLYHQRVLYPEISEEE